LSRGLGPVYAKKLRAFGEKVFSTIEEEPHRTDKAGQFVLDVETPADNVDAVFETAQVAEEASDIDTAERLYRRVIYSVSIDFAELVARIADSRISSNRTRLFRRRCEARR
jgi:hypothetical protein